MSTIKVIAAPGLSVPMEDKPRVYIKDDAAVDVPDTTYYRRRLFDSDLLEVEDDQAAKKPPRGATVKTTGD